MGNGAMI